MQISGKTPLSSHKMTLKDKEVKQQINGQKRWKMKEKDLSSFGLVFTACLVLGRLIQIMTVFGENWLKQSKLEVKFKFSTYFIIFIYSNYIFGF